MRILTYKKALDEYFNFVAPTKEEYEKHCTYIVNLLQLTGLDKYVKSIEPRVEEDDGVVFVHIYDNSKKIQQEILKVFKTAGIKKHQKVGFSVIEYEKETT